MIKKLFILMNLINDFFLIFLLYFCCCCLLNQHNYCCVDVNKYFVYDTISFIYLDVVVVVVFSYDMSDKRALSHSRIII